MKGELITRMWKGKLLFPLPSPREYETFHPDGTTPARGSLNQKCGLLQGGRCRTGSVLGMCPVCRWISPRVGMWVSPIILLRRSSWRVRFWLLLHTIQLNKGPKIMGAAALTGKTPRSLLHSLFHHRSCRSHHHLWF